MTVEHMAKRGLFKNIKQPKENHHFWKCQSFQRDSETPQVHQVGPGWAKMGPRSSKATQDSPRKPPGLPQDEPRRPQCGPQEARECPGGPQDGPRVPQDGPQEGPKRSQDEAKMAQKRPCPWNMWQRGDFSNTVKNLKKIVVLGGVRASGRAQDRGKMVPIWFQEGSP